MTRTQMVRGGISPESVILPRDSEKYSDQLTVDGPQEKETQSVWNKNGVVESSASTTNPVMGAVSWPALSESTRSGSKPLVSSEQTILQVPVVSQTQLKPAKTNANNRGNATKKHHGRQQTVKCGNSAGVGYAGHNRPLLPPPPPLPPAFPIFDMTYYNYVPPMLDSPVRPRPAGGSARRNNFGSHPCADGAFSNNGYGGRGPRGPASRDVRVPQQRTPPPPPPPRGYFRRPHMSPTSFMVVPPTRPYGTPVGYEMAAPFPYVPTHLLPQVGSPSMLIPFMDPLHVQILNQIEYYFSDTNLVKDNFLRSNMDDEGWVPISLIAGFNRVQNLTTNVQKILDSLKYSSAIETQGDKIRRHNDWVKWVQLIDVPHGVTNDSVEETSIENLTLEEVTTKEYT